MDFDLSDEQRLLKDSVERLLADRYDFEARKGYAKNPEGWSRELWKQYAELGLLGLPFDEQHGGFGGGPVETMIVMEAFGRALALEPYLATVVLGGGFIKHGGSDAQRSALLPQIADGSLRLAFAHTERQSRYDLADVATTAKRDGDAWVLDGEKGVVLHGDTADKLVVTARTAGGRRDRGGIGLFLVDAKAPGVSRRGYPTQDGLRAAEVSLANVRVGAQDVIGDPEARCRSPSAWWIRRWRRCARKRSAPWARCTPSPSTTSRRASSSACRSAASRCCSTAPPTCSSRSSRRAAWRCSPP